jgi:hypothetical protein
VINRIICTLPNIGRQFLVGFQQSRRYICQGYDRAAGRIQIALNRRAPNRFFAENGLNRPVEGFFPAVKFVAAAEELFYADVIPRFEQVRCCPTCN